MKNPSKTVRAAVLLLVLCMISTAMMGGTFAKYTSEYAGADTALVARWQFEALGGTNGTALASLDSTEQPLDLFSHLYSTNINGRNGENGDYIIAPGVNDDFYIQMTFLSDVDAKVTVDFANIGSAAGLPIEYLVEGSSNWVNEAGLEKEFVKQLVANTNTSTPGTLVAADPADNTFTFKRSGVADEDAFTTIKQKVTWRWAFDGTEQAADTTHTAAFTSNDGTDTLFGDNSADAESRTSYVLNVSVKAEQIAPVSSQPGSTT